MYSLDETCASISVALTFPLWCSSSDHPQLSGSEEVTVEDESVLALRCDIWANPPVSSVSWTLNGSAVDLLAGGFTVTNDGFTSQLITNSVEKSLHEGTYQCTANFPVFGEHSKIFKVTVTGQLAQRHSFPETTSQCLVLCVISLLMYNQNLKWNEQSVIWSKKKVGWSPSSSSVEKTMKFPLLPFIAGVVVVCLTTLLAVVSRWSKIMKVTYKVHMCMTQGLTLTNHKLNPLMIYISFDSAASNLCILCFTQWSRCHEDITPPPPPPSTECQRLWLPTYVAQFLILYHIWHFLKERFNMWEIHLQNVACCLPS